MAVTASAEIHTSLFFRATRTTDTAGRTLVTPLYDRFEARNRIFTLAAGTGAGQINEVVGLYVDLVASTPQTIDLTAIAWAFGAKDLSVVKAVIVANEDTDRASGTVVTAFNSGTDAWYPFATDVAVPLGPTDMFIYTKNGAGIAVDATHKNLKLTPGAANVRALVALAGLS